MSISTKVLSNMPNVKFVFSHDERYCSSQSRLLENMNPKSLSLFDLYKNPKLIIPNTNQIFKSKIHRVFVVLVQHCNLVGVYNEE